MLISLVAGVVGTGLGGVLVAMIKAPDENLSGLMMGMSGGIMLSIVLFDMIPESFGGHLPSAIIGAILGVLLMHALQSLLSSRGSGGGHAHSGHRAHGHNRTKEHMRTTGLLMLSGIALHNLPEGFAIGSGLAGGPASLENYGMQLAILMMMHDIPEGVALAVPLKVSGSSPLGVIGAAAASGLPTVIGAGLGYMLGNMSENMTSGCIAFAGGAMLYITLRELLPDALQLSNRRAGLVALALGVLVGLGMIMVI